MENPLERNQTKNLTGRVELGTHTPWVTCACRWLNLTTQINTIEQHCLFKVVTSFRSVDEILKCMCQFN